MWVYAGILSIIGVLAILTLTLPIKSFWLRPLILVTAATVLSVFIGFRDEIGADWSSYDSIFQAYSHIEFREILMISVAEPCYALLNYIAYLLGGDVHLVNFACAVILILSLIRFAYLVDVDATFILFLSTPYLLFVVGMGYTRQAVAIGLGCCALGYWIHLRPRMFYTFALIAVGFHYSALVLLLIVGIKNWRRAFAVVLFLSVAASLVIGRYITMYFWNTGSLHSSGVWFRLMIILLGVAAATLQQRHWQGNPEIVRLLKIGSRFAITLIPIAIFASTLADRLCLYLFFIYLLTFGRAIRYSKPSLRFMALAATFTVTFGCLFLWFQLSWFAATFWVPYHNSLFSPISY